ncbi:hypothetical protein SAMN05216266_101772 [Amycolatopsis marina]|uniref:Tat (Twin-arginine translocation) pathway signal sequence n=1 Tax=Amycolatopsis marina TaxID=490629 RepID=A0A1I0W7U8_9PSEU|nr:hypothetical protein [Amycolatopsis marina]SFA84093.1 hypothetical protein SAMN05216266_101772 [Amycolatopsis marina]
MTVDRRHFLRLATGTGAGLVFSASSRSAFAQQRAGSLRVYVLVVDGCRPDEIGPLRTPNLLALRDGAPTFPRPGRFRSWRPFPTTP